MMNDFPQEPSRDQVTEPPDAAVRAYEKARRDLDEHFPDGLLIPTTALTPAQGAALVHLQLAQRRLEDNLKELLDRWHAKRAPD